MKMNKKNSPKDKLVIGYSPMICKFKSVTTVNKIANSDYINKIRRDTYVDL